MTTSQSPKWQLKKQADNIARNVKLWSRGQLRDLKFAEKLDAAFEKGELVMAIVMDDGVRQVKVSLEGVKSSREADIADMIYRAMRKETLQ